MKNTIKTVTLTIDELNKIVTDSASGNVEAAKQLISTKIQQKSERLEMQRELRRQRTEQKKAEAPKAKSAENSTDTVKLPLNKALAKCILWINNRHDALRSNISLIINEIARSSGARLSLTAIEDAMQRLLHWAKVAAQTAHDHLYAKHRLRPASVTIPLD